MSTEKDKIRKITQYDFLSFYERPEYFWCLTRGQVEKIIDDLGSIPSKEKNLFKEIKARNNKKEYEISLMQQKQTYIEQFGIDDEDIHDFSKLHDSTDKVRELLNKKSDCFIFMPSVSDKNFVVHFSLIYKYKNYVYAFGSSIPSIFFSEFVLQNYLKIRIDCYFTFGKSPQNFTTDFLLTTTASKNKKIECNINHLLKKPQIPKKHFLTAVFMSEHTNVTSWGDFVYDSDEIGVAVAMLRKRIQNLSKHEPTAEEIRSLIDIDQLCHDFLERKDDLIKPDAHLYEKIFRGFFKEYCFCGFVMNFKTVVKHLKGLATNEQRKEFLANTTVFEKLKIPLSEGEYAVLNKDAKTDLKNLENIEHKVFYDFETMSLSIGAYGFFPPYSQIALQVSVINVVKAKGVEKTHRVNNLILDPQTFVPEQLKDVVDAVYKKNAHYIVYNKSFENTRLKEIGRILNDPDYSKKIGEIIENTIDLADWLDFRKKNIVHKKLYGYYSIKKVIEIIPKCILEECDVLEYSMIEDCQDGLIAQNFLNERYLLTENNNKTQEDWEDKKIKLEIYCENDVKMMIAVYCFIKSLINNYEFLS